MTPFFASNGAIIHGKSDRDTYNVSVEYLDDGKTKSATVSVDTDTTQPTPDGEDWSVEHSPTWLHTPEQGDEVDAAARWAVTEYYHALHAIETDAIA